VVKRRALTDDQWRVIEPLLPPSGAAGRPRVDDRRVINESISSSGEGLLITA
jgi:transposase